MQGTRRFTGLAVVLCAIFALVASRAVAAELPSTPDATVDVNVVFIGFEERQFGGHEQEPHDFQGIYGDVVEPVFLPHRNDPIIRAEGSLENPTTEAEVATRLDLELRSPTASGPWLGASP